MSTSKSKEYGIWVQPKDNSNNGYICLTFDCKEQAEEYLKEHVTSLRFHNEIREILDGVIKGRAS